MDEKAFLESIDCYFPYTDEVRGRELVRQGCELSAAAAFGVVLEIARPGRSVDSPRAIRHRLLDAIDAQLEHPAKAIVLPVARRMVDGEELGVDDAVAAMRRLESVGCISAALNVLYFSCDDVHGVVEAEFERIRGDGGHPR